MIFDMDGTLLDSMWYWRTIWREYAAAQGIALPPELIGQTQYGCGKACDILSRELNGAKSRQDIFNEMMVFLEAHYRRDVRPKPFAGELLAELKRAGYIVGVATATRRQLAIPALERHGLMKDVDFVTDCDEMGSSKSKPEFFLNVAARIGCRPEECVMFEDAVYAVRSAKQAGMTVCVIDEPVSYPDRDEIRALADRYVSGWGELLGKEPPRYRNIVFDFGNVVARFNPDMLIARFCENEADRPLLKKAVADGWADLDTGAIDNDGHRRRVLDRVPQRLHESVNRLFEGWVYAMPYVDGMPELIAELKEKGYHLYLLSNAPTYFDEHRDFYRVLDGFDGVVVSASVKMHKPDRAIFDYLLSAYALDPSRTLFIDDNRPNVDGARACGLDAYHFSFDTDALRQYILG